MSVQALQRKFILISAGAILIVMGVILLLLNGYNLSDLLNCQIYIQGLLYTRERTMI